MTRNVPGSVRLAVFRGRPSSALFQKLMPQLRSIIRRHKRFAFSRRDIHTWEECRRCGGLAVAEARTCKRALRWRPVARVSSCAVRCASAAIPNLLPPLLLRLFRSPKSGNRNVHGFPANCPPLRCFANGMTDRFGFSAGRFPVDSLAIGVPRELAVDSGQ
jgi:hypothetical protein